MRRRLVGGIYIVQAAKDGVTEYWAAVTLQENGLPQSKRNWAGWTVTLTDRRLTSQRLSMLKMRPNTVRKL